MTYLALATVGFISNWIFLRKKVLEYAIVASFIYLITFVFVQSFDILFVVYTFFFIIPHIKDFRRMSPLYFVFIVYILIELAIGLFYEPIASVAATFLTRFFPIIFISLIRKNGDLIPQWDDEYEQKILRLTVVCELIISIILVFKGNRGEIFVVAHQPVGANLSLVGVFLAMDIALKSGIEKVRHKYENILYLIIFIILAMISGIRGYIIIIIPCAFYAIISYLYGVKKRRAVLLFTILFAIGILFISYLMNGKLATMLSNVDTSIGYRVLENQYFIQSSKAANPIRWIFGYGIGAREGRIGSDTLIFTLAAGNKFYIDLLTNGVIFLNFWFTLIKDMGIIGFAIYLIMYFKLIPRKSSGNKDRRNGWILYAVLYAFMLIYRTSCTNGLIELYIFTLVMNNQLFSGHIIQNDKHELLGGNALYTFSSERAEEMD